MADIAKMLAMMGKSKKKPVEVDVDAEPGDDGDIGTEGLKAAMADFVRAVKLGDIDGAVEAWHNLQDCDSGPAPKDSDDSED